MANRWLAGTLAVGVVLGLLAAKHWPQTSVHAVATHGQDNFAICTMPMDQDVEAVCVLDCTTGELRASVLNVQTRRFNSHYECNVLRDMQLTNIKNPQFRIVTGYSNFRQHAGSGQLASSVLYIAEAHSGQLIAYGIPWVSGRATAVAPAGSGMIPLDRWQFKLPATRPQ